MKVYTEVVWKWDDAKKELVEESSKSYEYEGPVVQAWTQYVALGLALLSAYGGLKGTEANKKGSKTKAKMMLNQAGEYERYAKELEEKGDEQAAHFMTRARDLRKAYEMRGSAEIALSVAQGASRVGTMRAAYSSSGARVNEGSPVDAVVFQALQNDVNTQTIAFNMAMSQKTAMKQGRHNAYVAQMLNLLQDRQDSQPASKDSVLKQLKKEQIFNTLQIFLKQHLDHFKPITP